jgi:hypothetical protein
MNPLCLLIVYTKIEMDKTCELMFTLWMDIVGT